VRPDTRRLYVQDLARSGPARPPVQADATQRDWVTDNTDFESIVIEREPFFFDNDLSSRTPSKNSHWGPDTVATKSYAYIAAIVWPIQKTRIAANNQRRDDVVGYLCVDSLTKGCFDEKADFYMGAAYADTLYTALKQLVQLRSRPANATDRKEVDIRDEPVPAVPPQSE